jgi:hypothetical protein
MTAPGLLRLHRRQFVAGPGPFRARDDWLCRQLGPSVWISHCPELRTAFARDADGTVWGLLGLAVQTLEERPNPPVQIAAARSRAVPQLSDSWAGRWALIGADRLQLDGSGRLGCFYGAAGAAVWASSSPAVLARALSLAGPLRADPRSIRYESGISWFTPPRSRLIGMRRLLPSQLLDLRDGSIEPHPLLPADLVASDYARAVDLFSRSLLTALRRLPEDTSKWLGLTAGYDSRLVLAVACAGGVELSSFTRIVSRMSLADRAFPPGIARKAGCPHTFLRGREPEPARARLVAEHSADHVSAGDAQPLLTGVRDSLRGIAISTNGFSLAGGFGNLRTLPAGFESPQSGARRLAALFGERDDSTATDGLREWLEWVEMTPHDGLDWRDRFFIEQRMGGWQSSKEQVYDLAPLERFPVINAARSNALLLAIDRSEPPDQKFQERLIAALSPELLEYPFNPPDRDIGLLRTILVKSRDDPLFVLRKAAARGWRARRGRGS